MASKKYQTINTIHHVLLRLMKNFRAEWTGSYPNLCSGV